MKKTILPNWDKVVESGFSDKHNMCIWSMKEYKNFLFVGTLNFTNGCEVYRSKSGDKGTWEKVCENGFDIKRKSDGARTMYVFNDLLWIVTYCRLYGSQVWVTNGEYDDKSCLLKWKKANIDGFGQGNIIPGSRAVTVYKKNLYVGTECKDRLPRIYRYDGLTDFDKIQQDRWIWVNEEWEDNNFNIPNFSLIGEILSFKDFENNEYIYISVYSDIAHLVGQFKRKPNFQIILEIVKFFYKKRLNILRFGGNKWEMGSKPGFGKKNIMAMASLVYRNTIYFGTTKILGGEIWKSDDGITWIRIMKRGFSFPFNLAVWKIHTFENRLVIGMQNQWFGCQVWASKNKNPNNNKDFIQIAKTGMSKKLQLNPFKIKQDGIKAMETFNGKLYVGTASYVNILNSGTIIGPGCEIWRIDHI